MKTLKKEKLEKYQKLTTNALEIAEQSINKEKQSEAKIILEMVSCYLADSKHFQSKNDFVNSFACVNYAHGWLDCGARLGIFSVKDRKLFVVNENS